jgi:Zn-dependent M28 family amino/carboxypeptidase
MKTRSFIVTTLAAILCLQGCGPSARDENVPVPVSISDLLSQASESQIYATASDLQNFVTRVAGTQGNYDAATYLHDKLAAISGLTVVYQGGNERNVIATLPGTDATSDKVYIVGAHYDSTSDTPGIAPGATDNACGVGIVLELARIMSKYRFKDTLKFAAWNSEESGRGGSLAFVNEAVLTHENIELYFNYDSAGYDPGGRLILDIMYNDSSAGIATLMDQRNSSFGLGFTITHNVHTCTSDHRSFWEYGFRAVMTHAEQHAPEAHTAYDTVDKMSTLYAKKNGQLGMAILAELAGLSAAR